MADITSNATPALRPFAWFPEFLVLSRSRLRNQARLLGAAVLVGVVAGLGAVVFSLACNVVVYFALNHGAGYHPAEPANEHTPSWLPSFASELQPWTLLLIPTLGGLISGVLVFAVAPEAEGHGTDAVIAAYHNPKGRIRYRVPFIKTIASAITIGTGGSGGREGPIAQIGAGFGFFLGDLLRLRSAERRVLMAAGMGAGVAAIFRAPLAGALFAAEVLYFSPEFEPEAIMPAGLASVVSYCTFGLFLRDGWQPLFDTPNLTFDNPWQLGPYLLLALLMIFLAMIYTRSFYGLTNLFHRIPLPRHVKPALGALLTGATGLALYFGFAFFGHGNTFVLSVLSFGYGSLQGAMDDSILKTVGGQSLVAAAVLISIALGKIFTTGLTIGSGGSGGVFGPSMVIGGCAGGALGLVLQTACAQLGVPAVAPSPAAFVLVGMAGFFAAAAKTPFSTMIIVSEMTGNYNLLLPALFVCTVTFLFSDKQSLYRNQVVSRAASPAHQGSWVREVLAGIRVSQFLKPNWEGPMLRPDEPVVGVIDRFDPEAGDILPVIDGDRRLLGVVSLEEVHVAAQLPHAHTLLLAADLMRRVERPLRADDRLDRAMELFNENDLLTLPVVDENGRVIGVVRRFDAADAYLRRLHAPPTPSSATLDIGAPSRDGPTSAA
jgi:CIC family chloride channel protein